MVIFSGPKLGATQNIREKMKRFEEILKNSIFNNQEILWNRIVFYQRFTLI